MQRFAYPIALTPDITDGGLTVTCREKCRRNHGDAVGHR